MVEAIINVNVAREVRPPEQVNPQRLRELDHVTYMQREGLLPNKKDLRRIGQKEGMGLALEERLRTGLDSARDNSPSNILDVLETARLFPVLDIKVPGQYRSTLPNLVRQCEQYLDTNGIPHKPKQRGVVRRRIVKGMAATAGLALAGGIGKIRHDLLNYGKHPTVKARPAPIPEIPPPSPTPEAEVDNFNDLIKPIIDEVNKRRSERAKSEPDYDQVVDKELNQNLINVGMVAWSEGHGESLTVLSYNMATGQVTSVSCTRETITPEVRRYLEQKNPDDKGADPFATNMFAYHTGGFNLMRKIIEEETGLSADLQVYISDTMLHDFIEKVLGNSVEIEVKSRIHLKPYDFNKWEYTPEGYYLDPGKHKMTSDEALSYVLSTDEKLIAGKGNQPPGRKNDLIMAVFGKTMDQLRKDPVTTLIGIGSFMNDKLKTEEIAADFNIPGILTAIGYRAGIAKLRRIELKPPIVNRDDLMLNDTFFGDGGMIRVNRLIDEKNTQPDLYEGHTHPNVRKLIDQTIATIKELNAQNIPLDDPQRGLLTRRVLPVWLQVPIQGDPEAENLVTGWWPATRQLTKQRLFVR